MRWVWGGGGCLPAPRLAVRDLPWGDERRGRGQWPFGTPPPPPRLFGVADAEEIRLFFFNVK